MQSTAAVRRLVQEEIQVRWARFLGANTEEGAARKAGAGEAGL
jgi:hypothetical protein